MIRVLAGLVSVAAAFAAERAAVRVSTPGIEVSAFDTETVTRDAALHLDRVRAFFDAAGSPWRVPAAPVRVVAFASQGEYRAHSALSFASAHFQAAGDEGYIVLPDLGVSSYPAAVHELVHVYVREAGARLPVWLEEGLAEYYSTLAPAGDRQVRVGEPPPGRVQTLAERLPVAMGRLLEARRASPYLAELEPGRLFYAQSWALVHMLAHSGRYRDGFARFLALAAGGKPAPESLREVFGRSVAEAGSDLEDYVRRGRYETRTVAVEAVPEQPRLRRLSAFEWAETLAGLRAAGREGWEGVRGAYEELAAAYPERPEPWVTLARRAAAAGRLHEARAAYGAAIGRGPAEAAVWREYADLMAGDMPGDERVRLLRRAAEANPGDEGIRRRLALALYESLRFAEARRIMLEIGRVEPAHAAEYYRVLAYVSDQLGLFQEARQAAAWAVEAAATAAEAEWGRRLLELLNRPAPSPPPMASAPVPAGQAETPESMVTPSQPLPAAAPKQRGTPLYPLQGELLQVDCYGRAAVIWIRTAHGRAGFEVADTQQVALTREGQAVRRYFTCGPQKPEPVVVRYEIRRNETYGTRGIARAVEFPQPAMR